VGSVAFIHSPLLTFTRRCDPSQDLSTLKQSLMLSENF
jgi:hypothetical protein